MASLLPLSQSMRGEQEVCRERLDQLIRVRNCLIIKQKDAKQESSELRQETTNTSPKGRDGKRRKVALPGGGLRYEALTRTRDINVKLKQWETDFNTHLAAYSRALCLPIALGVQNRLPREIRDLIYTYMLDRIVSIDPNRHLKLTLWSRDQPKKMWNIISPTFPFVNRYSMSASPHYDDSAYVGLDFAKELIQMHYQKCCFAIHEREFGILDTFLQQEPHGYGVRVGQMIRRMELTVMSRHSIGWDEQRRYEVKFEETVKSTLKQKQKLELQLSALLRIETRCEIDLHVCISRGSKSGLFQFGEIMHVLLPIIEQLKGKGCKIDLTVHSSTVEPYGSLTFYGTWKIVDEKTEPIEKALRRIMEEYKLPGMEGLDAESVDDFEARFMPHKL